MGVNSTEFVRLILNLNSLLDALVEEQTEEVVIKDFQLFLCMSTEEVDTDLRPLLARLAMLVSNDDLADYNGIVTPMYDVSNIITASTGGAATGAVKWLSKWKCTGPTTLAYYRGAGVPGVSDPMHEKRKYASLNFGQVDATEALAWYAKQRFKPFVGDTTRANLAIVGVGPGGNGDEVHYHGAYVLDYSVRDRTIMTGMSRL